MKKVKIIFAAILAMMLLCCTTAAFAEASVTYDGAAKEFIFAPGSEYSLTDLFENFKGVMPGDTLEQQILVKNNADKKVDVKIYMRSLGAAEGSEEILKQMKLNVKNGSTELFEAPANETAQLTDWVLLGTFKSGAEITLDVTLDIPIEMGSDFAAKAAYLDWQFKVEEFPIKEPPKTGDNSNLALWIAILAVCIAACVVAVVVMKKRNTNEK